MEPHSTSWLSQRQATAISTTEFKLVAAGEAARELAWLRRLMNEITTLKYAPTLETAVKPQIIIIVVCLM